LCDVVGAATVYKIVKTATVYKTVKSKYTK
jgi:hypothetical protein